MPELLLRDLPGAIPPNEAYERIQSEDLFWPENSADDEAALKIVMGDVEKAESFLVSRQYIRQWDLADRLFYAYVVPENWPGTEIPRSSLGMPLLSTHLFSILSQVQQAIFSGLRPFECDPKPNTSSLTAEANQALLTWETERCAWKQEIRMVAYDSILYGMGLGMWGYEPVVRLKQKKVKKPGSLELGIEKTSDEYVLPTFEYVNIRHYLVDPGCRRGDVRTAKWFARRLYLSADELDELRDVDGFQNIPTRDQFALLTTPEKEGVSVNPLEMGSFTQSINLGRKALPRWMDTTSDPLKQGFEVIEYWTKDHVFHVLERQLVIRNKAHNLGRIPAVSVPFYEAPDSFYGVGITHLIGNYQSVMQGVVNLFLDDMSLNLNGMFVSKKGMNETGQAIWASPGKVIRVDDPQGFDTIKRQPVGPDAMGMISACEDWAQTASGANEITVQGTMPAGRSSITRTATGANKFAEGSQTRMQCFIDQLADLVMLPTLEAFIDLNFDNLTPEQVKDILGNELGHQYSEDTLNIINGGYKLSISAGSRLQARNALSQSLPTLVQMITSPNITQGLNQEAKKVNYGALVDSMFTATGYPGRQDIIVPMTKEDEQRMMQMNPVAQQQQLQQSKIQQTADSQLEVEEAKAGGRALLQVIKHGLEQDAASMTPQ